MIKKAIKTVTELNERRIEFIKKVKTAFWRGYYTARLEHDLEADIRDLSKIHELLNKKYTLEESISGYIKNIEDLEFGKRQMQEDKFDKDITF